MISRKFRFFLAVVVLVGIAAGSLLFVTPPRPVLRLVVRATSSSLMSGHEAQDGRVGGTVKRIVRAWVQTSLAAHMAGNALEAGGTDEEILARLMTEARRSVLYPRLEMHYDPKYWPSLVSGIGYCDQLNGAICLMARHHFEKAELIALYSKQQYATPHTVGRVWSKQRQDWLYFDAFYEKPVIYTRAADGRITFLDIRDEGRVPARPATRADIYELPGWKLSGFGRTFGQYILQRLRPEPAPALVADLPVPSREPAASSPAEPRASSPAAPRASSPAAPPATTATPNVPPTPEPKGGIMATAPVLSLEAHIIPPQPLQHRRDEVYDRIARAYLDARLRDLLGQEGAREAYLTVATDTAAASDDRAAEVAAAARVLAGFAD